MSRVVHCTNVHPWADTRIFQKMCVSSAKAGHDVHLVAIDTKADADQEFTAENVTVHLLAGRNITSRFRRSTLGARNVLRAAKLLKPDILHFHDPELLPWVALRWMSGVAKIYDVHENLPDQIMTKEWMPGWIKKPAAMAVRLVEHTLSVMLSGVVTATPKIAERFKHKSAVVIYNYPILESARGDCTVGEETSVLYIGGISKARGIVELIEACEMLDVVDCLQLAGPISDPGLSAELEAMPGWSKVRYWGVVDRSRILELLEEATVGAVTLHPFQSFKDSFPIKTFEYLSAGLPIVASDFELWRKTLGDVPGVEYADPTSPKSIADAIMRILTTPPEDALSRRSIARDFVERQASWQSEEKKLLDLYQGFDLAAS